MSHNYETLLNYYKNGTVAIAREAKLDILDILIYNSEHEGMAEAERRIGKLENVIHSLCGNPERGHILPELEKANEFNYREAHCPPFIIIYKIVSEKIIVYCVLNGRRDMRSPPHRRLIRLWIQVECGEGGRGTLR